MCARTKSDARDNFAGFFKESLSCLSNDYVQTLQKSPNRYVLTFEPPAIVLCPYGNRTVDISQIFRIGEKDGEYKAITLQYDYTLNAEIDGQWKELVSYHWHPDESEVRTPHLHVGCQCFPRVHFPTRRISVERFIAMLFDYYDIEPELPEAQWKEILEKNDTAFVKGSTWV